MKSQIHTITTDAVYSELGSCAGGLGDKEAQQRLSDTGENVLKKALKKPWYLELLKQFSNFFTLLLIVSGLISFGAHLIEPGEGMAPLGFALFGVAIFNVLFSFLQEFRAEKAMEALKAYLPAMARVIRDSKEVLIPAEQLVPGDVLVIREGDKISADARLTEVTGLMVNNASLTGESRAVSLTTDPQDGRLADSRNILFAGTTAIKGNGKAVVFATGMRTEFGKIAVLSQATQRLLTPLEKETNHMVRILTAIAVGMGLLFFVFGVISGRPFLINLVFMMGIIVALVPEGLLPTFTLSLAMASVRMASRKALVRHLGAVADIGAVHVICTDKTGTLTLNQLQLTAAALKTEVHASLEKVHLDLVQKSLIACDLSWNGEAYQGDPLDIAVAQAAKTLGAEPDNFLNSIKLKFAFDLNKRRSAGLAEKEFVVKGAWESIRPLLTEKSAEPTGINFQQWLESWDEKVNSFAREGFRVIAVASRKVANGESHDQDSLEKNLELDGFLGLEDPLRKEIPGAVEKAHLAGIQVVMITGDHPATALAVAKKAAISPQDETQEQVLTGLELEQLNMDQLAERLNLGVHVIARATPEQKMKIIGAYQKLGMVVAMTGDGVNDAPALKAADVGVSMGLSGTDVARESSHIVLLDDNFASIVSAVEEGRTVFDNIRKFSTYVLASNVPEMFPFLAYVTLGVPLGLTIPQILSIDLGTDTGPAIALGQEPPSPNTMTVPPRKKSQKILDMTMVKEAYLFLGMIQAFWSMSCFFLVLNWGGWSFGEKLAASDPLYIKATTITLISTIFMQIGNLIGRRSTLYSGFDKGLIANKLMLIGIGAIFIFSALFMSVDPIKKTLGTDMLGIKELVLCFLGIPFFMLLDNLRKWWFRRKLATTVNSIKV